MHEKIALFAGNGDLPHKLTQHFKDHRVDHTIVAFEGMTEKEPYMGQSINWHKVGHVAAILKTLRSQNVTHIVMAGNLKRPSIGELSLDREGMKWIARMGMAALSGDDGFLSKLIQLMEGEGFKVVSPHSFLTNMVCEPGLLTKKEPSEQALHDIEKGKAILNALSPFDVGQAIVVREGLVLGIETSSGTTAMLEQVRQHKIANSRFSIFVPDTGRYGGVLVKLSKNNQSLLVDLPTIGVNTIAEVVSSGLSGIAISARTTQILDKEEVIAMCNDNGVFLIAIDTTGDQHV
ncbi:MAG: UDP-2,3-diacylglucosamine diphosphatase LpxI [Alphaproteobacteria bacterium]|nr:UDP-2,3-diacylglucosamine diphosphatase LpxI [Alphaproteobacteria bacterium]